MTGFTEYTVFIEKQMFIVKQMFMLYKFKFPLCILLFFLGFLIKMDDSYWFLFHFRQIILSPV